MAPGLRTGGRLPLLMVRLCTLPRVTERSPGNLPQLMDCQAESDGHPKGVRCGLHCPNLIDIRRLCGKLSPTGPTCIRCFQVGAPLPQNATASGRLTASTFSSVRHTAARMALIRCTSQPISG